MTKQQAIQTLIHVCENFGRDELDEIIQTKYQGNMPLDREELEQAIDLRIDLGNAILKLKNNKIKLANQQR